VRNEGGGKAQYQWMQRYLRCEGRQVARLPLQKFLGVIKPEHVVIVLNIVFGQQSVNFSDLNSIQGFVRLISKYFQVDLFWVGHIYRRPFKSLGHAVRFLPDVFDGLFRIN
jgi:hypothetical protein